MDVIRQEEEAAFQNNRNQLIRRRLPKVFFLSIYFYSVQSTADHKKNSNLFKFYYVIVLQ